MIDELVAWVLGLVATVVSWFPEADFTGIEEALYPAKRLICWLIGLNDSLPVFEALGAVGIIAGVSACLYVAMLIRRIFSLFWPGAGS